LATPHYWVKTNPIIPNSSGYDEPPVALASGGVRRGAGCDGGLVADTGAGQADVLLDPPAVSDVGDGRGDLGRQAVEQLVGGFAAAELAHDARPACDHEGRHFGARCDGLEQHVQLEGLVPVAHHFLRPGVGHACLEVGVDVGAGRHQENRDFADQDVVLLDLGGLQVVQRVGLHHVLLVHLERSVNIIA